MCSADDVHVHVSLLYIHVAAVRAAGPREHRAHAAESGGASRSARQPRQNRAERHRPEQRAAAQYRREYLLAVRCE